MLTTGVVTIEDIPFPLKFITALNIVYMIKNDHIRLTSGQNFYFRKFILRNNWSEKIFLAKKKCQNAKLLNKNWKRERPESSFRFQCWISSSLLEIRLEIEYLIACHWNICAALRTRLQDWHPVSRDRESLVISDQWLHHIIFSHCYSKWILSSHVIKP